MVSFVTGHGGKGIAGKMDRGLAHLLNAVNSN